MSNRAGVVISDGFVRLHLENIKCGGCANTISSELSKQGLKEISVDHENGTVRFQNVEDEKLTQALGRLKSLGYPLVETEEGLAALGLKAKSYVSCAIGKMK